MAQDSEYEEGWEWRLGLLFEHDNIQLAAAVTAVRLINPARADEESAIAYWRQIAGESLAVEVTPNLIVGFLTGAITIAWERVQSGDLGPTDRGVAPPEPTEEVPPSGTRRPSATRPGAYQRWLASQHNAMEVPTTTNTAPPNAGEAPPPSGS